MGICQGGSLKNSYASVAIFDSVTNIVSSSTYSGGLIGYASSMSLQNNYVTGSILGKTNYLGGLIGYGRSVSITDNYASVKLEQMPYTGALIGCVYYDTVSHSYWNTDTAKGFAGIDTIDGANNVFTDTLGYTTAQMKTQSNFTGWDFKGETTNGSADLWAIAGTVNNGFPYLAWQDSSNGATAVAQSSTTPMTYVLRQNYPNPFNPSTTISYDLPKQSHVTIQIYDILGKEITTLVNETKNVGSYKVVWNASRLSSGVYFYRMTAGSFSSVKRLLLIK
jgi:hypothetical protein